ncbi:hypothetical protein D3C80_1414720 [compost metagenome]
MAAMAVLHPDQAKALRDLHFTVTHFDRGLVPLGKTRALYVAQSGFAVTDRRNLQHKVPGSQRLQPQGVTRCRHVRVGLERLLHLALLCRQFTCDVDLLRSKLSQRIKHHQIGNAACGNQPEIVALQTNGGIERGHPQHVGRRQALFDQHIE